MSIIINKKIKAIRQAEHLTQKEFSDKTKVPVRSIINYENTDRMPSFEPIHKVCEAFPEYTYYVMHDKMPKKTIDGQITPEEKIAKDKADTELNRQNAFGKTYLER